MTDFANYTELQEAIGTHWLNRSDLDERVPSFIQLGEADIRRDLRARTVIDALTLDSNAVALPAACAELRSVRFNTSSLQHSLDARSHSALNALRKTGTGRPSYYAVVGSTLLLDIEPDSDYETEITYFEALEPLSAENPTNHTLLTSPDIYLYAALTHASPYLDHDERVATWIAGYDRAVVKENKAREESEMGSAPTSIGLPVVF